LPLFIGFAEKGLLGNSKGTKGIEEVESQDFTQEAQAFAIEDPLERH